MKKFRKKKIIAGKKGVPVAVKQETPEELTARLIKGNIAALQKSIDNIGPKALREDFDPEKFKEFVKDNRLKAFNADSMSHLSNAELSNLAKAAGTAATLWFLMTDNYNMVMLKSNGNDVEGAQTKFKERFVQEGSRLFYQTLLIDGVAAPANVGKFQKNGVTYVALAPMAQALDSSVEIGWDGSTANIYSSRLSLSAKVGQLYLVANGRYLYLPEGVQIVNNMVTVPLWAVVEAFDATLSWNGSTGTIQIKRGSGGIQSGDSYYDQEDLFWLSRIIYAESGNQSLEGQMAVGNVVMNRVASPAYPNTVQGVLAQKNQFTTYKSGALANRTPNQSSVIAAKLVLDGGEVEETDGALYFDSSSNSWASRNREFAATLGGHKFYY